MASLDRRFKQRFIGAVVLVLLAVTFLPMLFDRHETRREVRVDAPPMPALPAMRPLGEQQVAVPEPQAAPVVADPTIPEEHIDGDGLPITWAVLVARLGAADAEVQRGQLAAQSLDAYVRIEGQWHAVYIGPFIDLEVAEQHLDRIAREGVHSPLLVRFQPQQP